ncbi:hypothetical protein TM7_0630 [candidate division TM7 genomosp. GTL1]|nr:hypothetical protein TM7_0630 [candidate division TM7 genomosp. GTL1]
MEALNLIQFYNSFATEEQCQKFLFEQRWADGVVCPKCGEIDVKYYKLASGRMKCASCRSPFTVRMGSIFEESPVPLQKWFLAIYLCTSLKKGVSSIQLSKYIGVTQKTAWFMLQRIRHVFENGTFEKLRGLVEVDEAYIGGSDKNKHHNKKLKTLTGKGAQGHGSKNSKAPVVGMVERGGRLRAVAIKNMSNARRTALLASSIATAVSILLVITIGSLAILRSDSHHTAALKALPQPTTATAQAAPQPAPQQSTKRIEPSPKSAPPATAIRARGKLVNFENLLTLRLPQGWKITYRAEGVLEISKKANCTPAYSDRSPRRWCSNFRIVDQGPTIVVDKPFCDNGAKLTDNRRAVVSVGDESAKYWAFQCEGEALVQTWFIKRHEVMIEGSGLGIAAILESLTWK